MRTLNTYRLTATATCPVDEAVVDVYEVTIESDYTREVEMILAAVRDATRAPIFQEDLTQRLAHLTRARVTLVGIHSGVRVESEAIPE